MEALLFMVKGNKFFLRIASFLVLIIYVPYLLFDHFSQPQFDQQTALEKAQNVLNIKPDSLILGGSNAFYSLGAKYLSEHTEFNWLNLALNYEGFSDENYWKYITKSLTASQREQIENVVYSSVRPMRAGSVKRREQINDIDTFGIRSLNFIPNRSLGSRIKSWLISPKKQFTYDTSTLFGDLIFTGNRCNNPEFDTFSRELDPTILNKWVSSQVDTILKLFPNAKVFFVLPSEFYDTSYNKTEDETSFLIILRIIKSFQTSKTKIELIKQPRFPNENLTCDVQHHANSEGRVWRTDNLLNFLEEHF